MEINRVIDFLETETLSVTFSAQGLKYLSLINKKGDELIDLKNFRPKEETNNMAYLLVQETLNFLETGSLICPWI